jgi:hypothetical protein
VFVGLISQADDQGRLVDNVRRLDGLLFPSTEDTCAPSLAKLADLGRIVRYEADSGQSIIQLVGWERHQKVQHPSREILPPPPPEAIEEAMRRAASGNPPEDVRRSSGGPQEANTMNGQVVETSTHGPSSGGSHEILTPHTKIPRYQDTKIHTVPSDQSAPKACVPTFEDFWTARPRRSGGDSKRQAQKAWNARMREGVEPTDIVAGMERYKAYLNATDRIGTEFVKQAATFLGPDRHWEEDWAPPADAAGAAEDAFADQVERDFQAMAEQEAAERRAANG